MKWWGCFVKKVENGGGCKKVDLSSTRGALCTVSVFFSLHFTFWGEGVRTHPTHPLLSTGLRPHSISIALRGPTSAQIARQKARRVVMVRPYKDSSRNMQL